jgi:hypothetical protein
MISKNKGVSVFIFMAEYRANKRRMSRIEALLAFVVQEAL